jgi:anti-anti-sigma factor
VTENNPALTVKAIRGSGGETVLAVEGDIDLTSADSLRGELLSAVEHGTTVLDLAEVGFCDSSGLRVLVEADRKARSHGATFRLAALAAPVEQLLELTKADEVLDVFPSVEAALKR